MAEFWIWFLKEYTNLKFNVQICFPLVSSNSLSTTNLISGIAAGRNSHSYGYYR